MVQNIISTVRDLIWSPPFLGFIILTACVLTVALGFIQVKNFCKSWRLVLGGDDEDLETGGKGDMSPFQAFLSALSVGIGNGCLAGTATAIFMGGPGAAFWMFTIGLLAMALRFAEVFLGVSFAMMNKNSENVLGGPFLYIKKLPFGKLLAAIYATACLFYGLTSGNAMQCNSISTALHDVTGISTLIIGVALSLFVLYIMLGGAQRIIAFSDAIVPFKVGLFFSSMIIVLIYYWSALIPTTLLIIKAALNPSAAIGGIAGVTVQRVFAISASRSINASESGLGTAAIFYSNTGSKKPYNDGTTSMLSTFISTNVVSTMVAVALVASNVWNSGEDGSVMVVSAYQTVFGVWGGWIIALLSISFGMGVFVGYGYIARQCWLYLTNNRFENFFIGLFCLVAFVGSVVNTESVWAMVDIGVAACLFINLCALLYFIPYMKENVLNRK